MRKYLSIACVFLLNNEVLSWIALAVIAWMAIVDFAKEVDREAGRPRT